MALLLTIPADSPLLLNSEIQVTRYYIKFGGIHLLHDERICELPIQVYALAEGNAKGERLLGTNIPIRMPVHNVHDLLYVPSPELSVYAKIYAQLTELLLARAGQGATVEDIL